MELRLTTGTLSVPILRDGERTGTLVFNPHDAAFAQKIYDLLRQYAQTREEAAAAFDQAAQGDGLPLLALIEQVASTIDGAIDQVFGPGTAQALFGGARDVDLYAQFFDSFTDLFQAQRREKVAPYLPPEEETQADGLV